MSRAQMEVRWGFIGAGEVTRTHASPAGAFTQEGSRIELAYQASRERRTVDTPPILARGLARPTP